MGRIISAGVVLKKWDAYVSKKTGEEVAAGSKKVFRIVVEHEGRVLECDGYMGNGTEEYTPVQFEK